MIFYNYIPTEWIRIFVIISLILSELTVKCRYLIAFVGSHFLRDVSMDAVFFHSSSSLCSRLCRNYSA